MRPAHARQNPILDTETSPRLPGESAFFKGVTSGEGDDTRGGGPIQEYLGRQIGLLNFKKRAVERVWEELGEGR